MKLIERQHVYVFDKVRREVIGSEGFLGTCFGRYDLVLDFFHESAKVASYKVSLLQKCLNDSASLPSSLSLSLCKQIAKSGQERRGPIRTYTFLRPRKSYAEALDGLRASIAKETELSASVLWNASRYSLILILDGDELLSVLEGIVRTRTSIADFVAEGSSTVSLEYSSSDRPSKGIRALVYARLKSRPGHWETRDPMIRLFEDLDSPAKRTGWFDISIAVRVDSLRSLQEWLFLFKEKYGSNVQQTGTVLLWDSR